MYVFRASIFSNSEYPDSFDGLDILEGLDTWISSNKIELVLAVRRQYPGPLMDLWKAVEKTTKVDLRRVRKLMKFQGHYTPHEISDLPGVIRVLITSIDGQPQR